MGCAWILFYCMGTFRGKVIAAVCGFALGPASVALGAAFHLRSSASASWATVNYTMSLGPMVIGATCIFGLCLVPFLASRQRG
jgi:hypothetical protein